MIENILIAVLSGGATALIAFLTLKPTKRRINAEALKLEAEAEESSSGVYKGLISEIKQRYDEIIKKLEKDIERQNDRINAIEKQINAYRKENDQLYTIINEAFKCSQDISICPVILMRKSKLKTKD